MPMLERIASQPLYVELGWQPGRLFLDLHDSVWGQLWPSILTQKARVELLLGRSDETHLPTFVVPGEGVWGYDSCVISPGGSAAGLYGAETHCSRAKLYRSSNMDSPLHQILTLVGLAILWQGATYGHF